MSQRPDNENWLADEFPPRTRSGKPHPDFDETQQISTPEAFRHKWVNRMTAATMVGLGGSVILILVGIAIRIFRWVSGL